MHKTMIYYSIRLDITLQIFKSLNIFWPQLQRKRYAEYNVFSYAFGCKKKALSDILSSRFVLKQTPGSRLKSARFLKFMSLRSWFSETLTLKTYRREWKLLSLFMFHQVTFILLIVSSLFLNLIAAQVVFSRTYNKTLHTGVLKMLRVNIT